MAELILHHYPTSPFAEKIRLILGYKGLSWRSVQIPPIMPKPDVIALTGGYRKTPILQIGADIYCDTALIADVLEHHCPAPPLFRPPHKGLSRALAQWADEILFWPAMAYSFVPEALPEIFADEAPVDLKAFAEDRSRMRGGAPRMPLGDATVAYRSYLRRLADMLEHQPFLLGEAPTIADFACYHPLWFTRRLSSRAGIFAATPAVLAWMDRIAAFGHGQSRPLLSGEALAVSAASVPAPLGDPVFQDDHGIALGSRVAITAAHFGPEPTEGELVAATRTHYTLRRTDPRAGLVHVHLPRVGYQLRRLD